VPVFLWVPNEGTPEAINHITALKLPKLSTASSYPNLLLHNLGYMPHDQHLDEHIEQLFNLAKMKYKGLFWCICKDLIAMSLGFCAILPVLARHVSSLRASAGFGVFISQRPLSLT